MIVSTNVKKISNIIILETKTVAAVTVLLMMKKKQIYGYIKVLNVSKQKGTNPGIVNFKDFKTIAVDLDFEPVER